MSAASARATTAPVDAIGHVVRDYLPRSATFIYTVLRFQRSFRPVVLARRTMNLSEFPLDEVHHLTALESAPRRIRRRATAYAARYRTTYSHRIAERAREEGCLALHAHFGWSGVAAIPAAVRTGLPLVTTFYGLDVSDPQRARGRRNPLDRLFADGTLFVCEGSRMGRHLVANGCPPDRVRVVRIGIDLGRWPYRPPARTRPLVVLQVSRFVEKKGIDLSLRAFAAARPRLGPSELWLIGDGRLRGDIEKLAERLGIAGSVRFLGMVSYTEYLEAIRRAHVCIQPSRTARDGDTEGGAPTVLLEMQAAGIPVVATRHADIPEVVADPHPLAEEEDVAGLADALVTVAETSEDDWLARSRRGRALVERQHDAVTLASAIEDLYREAIELHGGVAGPRGGAGRAH